jgi:F-type H+-transporting ATPase subunit a
LEKLEPIFSIFGFGVTDSFLVMWIITAVIAVGAIILGKNLEKIPSKRQNIVELVVESINGLVNDNMGPGYKSFIPYIGTLVIFILSMNVIGLIGIEPPTRDYNICLALALVSFVVVQWNAIRKIGFGHYLKGYFTPFAVMVPLNLIERFVLPVSLSLRLMGNMTAAVVVVGIVYEGLHGVLFGIAQIGIPIPVHFFFDVFDAGIQMFIFVMLTMINIKIIAEH